MSRLLDHWQGQRSERLFAGHRGASREVYVVTRHRVEPLPHRRYHDRTPFNWGVLDAGALELAAALLHDVRRRPEADDVSALAAGVIADLPTDGFVLSADDVRRYGVGRKRVSPADHRAATVAGQAWISAQCWLFPFAWMIRRPAERPVNAGSERTDR